MVSAPLETALKAWSIYSSDTVLLEYF